MLKWLSGNSSSGASNNGNYDNLTHVGKVYTINRHQVVVEEVIAEGGFAVVYKAKSSQGGLYALKRMAVNNLEDLHLARQEVAITTALSDCPNSVTFVDSCIKQLSSDVHEVLILMELYTGPSVVSMLNARLARQSHLTEPEVLKMFMDVVNAVARLHHRTKPIIHRDLKIENILSDGQHYILCDYGSCSVNKMHPEAMTSSQCEDEISRFTTLAYRSPEMVSLYSGKEITVKSDVWALGCMLYKLCFMTTPFGEQPLAIVSAQLTIPENSPYSEDLHSLIRYMLEADPEKRPDVWQVSEVASRIRHCKNPLYNAMRSPLPPARLPRARRVNEAKSKGASPPAATASKPAQSTPSLLKNPGISVTTTSISSRERPRPRTAGQFSGVRECSSASSSPIPTRHSVQQLTQTSKSRPQSSFISFDTPPQPPRGTPAAGAITSQLLQVASKPSDLAKSWDSGLDMFGAVPFSSSAGQSSTASSQSQPPNTNSSPDVVRRDLFGSTPFTSPPNPSPNPSTPRHPSPSSTSQPVDEFGALPFVTCLQ